MSSPLPIFLSMVALGLATTADGFFFKPEREIPRNYLEGQPVDLMVSKLTSFDTLIPLDYEALPLCQSDDVQSGMLEQLGDFWAWNHWTKVPYRIGMKEDVFCEQLCVGNLGPAEQTAVESNRVVQAIHRNYRHHWSVDGGLPAGRQMELKPGYSEEQYNHGFPLGYVGGDGLTYVYNHVNIHIFFQRMGDGTYRIVRFMVQPLSIHHDFGEVWDEDYPLHSQRLLQMVEIRNPIDSCDPNRVPYFHHTNMSMVSDPNPRPQLASGPVLFTYDVIWKEAKDVPWTSRWDVYMTNCASNSNGVVARAHHISYFTLVFLIYCAAMAIFFSFELKRANNRTTKLAADEERKIGRDLADVWLPPPVFLAVCCGTGAQLLFTVLCTVVSLILGWLEPTQQGNWSLGGLLFYVLFGTINGYVTASMLKIFHGTDWLCAMVLASFGFPGFVIASLSFLKIIGSSPFTSTFVKLFAPLLLSLILFLLTAILSLLGAYVGYRQSRPYYPVGTYGIPGLVPKLPWYISRPFTMAFGGLVAFGGLFLELRTLMASFWKENCYCRFGDLLGILLLAIIFIVQVAIDCTSLRLLRKDFQSWYCSFFDGGAVAFFILGYSFIYVHQVPVNDVSSLILYFGYMAVLSIGVFLMTSFLGLATSIRLGMRIDQGHKIRSIAGKEIAIGRTKCADRIHRNVWIRDKGQCNVVDTSSREIQRVCREL